MFKTATARPCRIVIAAAVLCLVDTTRSCARCGRQQGADVQLYRLAHFGQLLCQLKQVVGLESVGK